MIDLSIIIPAYNEAKLIGRCVRSVLTATATLSLPSDSYEIIVVDNNSTDETGRLAREAGAQVVFEPVNKIAASRNAGAAVARGQWFLFIDADSILDPVSLRQTLEACRKERCVGGGCILGFDEAPWTARWMIRGWNLLSRLTRVAAGSFVFCRAEAFRAVGGFGSLYAAEELDLSHKLQKWGRPRGMKMVILTGARHISSGRKFYLYSVREQLGQFFRIVLSTRRTLNDPSRLGYFYDGRR